MLTARPVLPGGHQQIGLAAEEGGNLQHVHGLGGHLAVGRLMHVGQHRQAGVLGDAAQNARALDEARPAIALHAGAVGLVVAGLEDVGNAEVAGDALNGLGHRARVGLGLDDARAGDQEELARADVDGADFKGVVHGFDCKGWAESYTCFTLDFRDNFQETVDSGQWSVATPIQVFTVYCPLSTEEAHA